VSAERVIANLLRIAREDLDGARLLKTRGNRNAIYRYQPSSKRLRIQPGRTAQLHD
jgi:hypothetical protein